MEKQVARFLQDHALGKKNAVNSKQVEALFGINGIALRSIVNNLRSNGVPICSGGVGYWYADTLEELVATRKQLISRVRGIERAIEGLDDAIIKQATRIKAKVK